MKIGIAFDLKPDGPLPEGAPDDLYEEFDAAITIQSISAVLRQLGHEVVELGDGEIFLQKLLANKPDLVFNFAEGTGTSRSREARVPAVCELLGIPYTGSDPLTMAAALDKDLTRRLALDAGVLVPQAITLGPPRGPYDGDFAEFPALLVQSGLSLPVILKPAYEGSSKGIRATCLVEQSSDFGPRVVELWNLYRQPVLVEEFIAGMEVTVGLIGNDPPQVFGTMSIQPKQPVEHFVYSLEVKRDYLRLIDYACPAPLSQELADELVASALTVWDTLGCRDVARLDFRIREGVPYFLEINPLPGLNPESSDLVIMARILGISHAELIEQIVNATLVRTNLA